MNGFEEKLRDEFAGRAMAAIVSSSGNALDATPVEMEVCAEVSYMLADAMIAAKKKREVN